MDDRPPLAILAGVRVVSFTQFLLGPSGVQFLADLGADVIKVEPPGGRLWERNWSGAEVFKNGVSVFFLLAHRNQRSLTLDLKHPDGRAVARRRVDLRARGPAADRRRDRGDRSAWRHPAGARGTRRTARARAHRARPARRSQ